MPEIPQHTELFNPPITTTENAVYGPEDVVWEPKILQPKLFDNYQGPLENLETKMIHVGVVDDQDKDKRYVMRFVAIDNPYFKENELKEGQEARTLYVMGGGLSDAVTGLGIAANMMDADHMHPDGNFRIKNVVILSHPDDQPRTVKHTDPQESESSLKRSKDIVRKAIQQATGEDDVKPIKPSEHVMMIGHSAGAQMAIELAQDLHAEELILIEPTGMSDLPNLSREFTVGTFQAALKQAERDGAGRFSKYKKASDSLLHAFTDAYGPYKYDWLGFAARLVPGFNRLPAAMRDKLRAGKRFGMPKPFFPAIPNNHTLDNDSTEQQRNTFTGKVTIVDELQAHVTNLLETKAANGEEPFTKEELAKYDALITQIKQAKATENDPHPTLDQNDLPEDPDIRRRFYERIAKGTNSLLTTLFPNAELRRIILDQGFSHFRMLQDPTFYKRLMAEVKSPTTE